MSPPCHFSNKALHKFKPYYKIDIYLLPNTINQRLEVDSQMLQPSFF